MLEHALIWGPTWSQRLHCEGNSQRSSGTPSPLSPSWAPCQFSGRRSISSHVPAPRSGSTSAPHHHPPEWAPAMVTSSLATTRQNRVNDEKTGTINKYATQINAQYPNACRTRLSLSCPGLQPLYNGDKWSVTFALQTRGVQELKRGKSDFARAEMGTGGSWLTWGKKLQLK